MAPPVSSSYFQVRLLCPLLLKFMFRVGYWQPAGTPFPTSPSKGLGLRCESDPLAR